MGIKLFSDSAPTAPPNPDPKRFKIIWGLDVGPYVVVNVHYPGCIPYDGNKIMVFRDSLECLLSRTELDPHFLQNDSSPIARFPADETGWAHARRFAEMLITLHRDRAQEKPR